MTTSFKTLKHTKTLSLAVQRDINFLSIQFLELSHLNFCKLLCILMHSMDIDLVIMSVFNSSKYVDTESKFKNYMSMIFFLFHVFLFHFTKSATFANSYQVISLLHVLPLSPSFPSPFLFTIFSQPLLALRFPAHLKMIQNFQIGSHILLVNYHSVSICLFVFTSSIISER